MEFRAESISVGSNGKRPPESGAKTSLSLIGGSFFWIVSAINGSKPHFQATEINFRVSLSRTALTNCSCVTPKLISQQFLLFAFGGLAASSFSIYVLIVDTEAFFYNYLLARLDLSTLQDNRPQEFLSFVLWVVQQRLEGLGGFFTGFSRHGLWQNIIIISLPLMAVGIVVVQRETWRSITWSSISKSHGVRPSIVISVSVTLSYFLADRFSGAYIHHIIPFVIIASVGILAGVYDIEGAELTAKKLRRGRRSLVIIFFALLVPYTGWFVSWASADILRRSEPSISRPLSISAVACWIEANTPPNSVVMSYIGTPVASAGQGRHLPLGYEQGQGMLEMFFLNPKKGKVKKHGILTDDQFLGLLETGKIPVIIHDSMIEKYTDLYAAVKNITDENYTLTDSTGGVFGYTILVSRQLDLKPTYSIVPQSTLQLSSERARNLIKEKYWGQLIGETAADIAVSVSSLLGDVKNRICSGVGVRL